MAEHNELGKRGEEIAEEHFTKKGFTILERNWRFIKAEVDIICTKGNETVFEVKTRSGNFFGQPEAAVTEKKKELLLRAATEYVFQKNINTEIRFDIISILFSGEKYELTHFEDAFFPYDF